jgi:phosphopantothenoylcysteine decarboxylase/phosphopantothenate--cysteine ligase
LPASFRDQACGEVGMGRMLESAELPLTSLLSSSKRLAGKRVVPTAADPVIDLVRGITNLAGIRVHWRAAGRGRRLRHAGR